MVVGTDMSDEQKTTEAPWAPGLDEWWRDARRSGNAADKEKAAIEAANFQERRALRYVFSEGREDIGGFVKSSPGGSRMID